MASCLLLGFSHKLNSCSKILLHRFSPWLRYDKSTRQSSSDLFVNHNLEIDPTCKIELDGGLKPRKHPGIMNIKRVDLPPRLQDAVTVLVDKFHIEDVTAKSQQLSKYLWSRHVPVEENAFQENVEKSERQILNDEKIDVHALSLEEREQTQNRVKSKVLSLLRKKIYHWEPVKYDAFRSLLYLVGRFAFDYSSTLRIFSEIAKRKPDFRPESIFHFGSGVGSAIWASSEVWTTGIKEHHCTDVSDDMNTVARLLLQGGKENVPMSIPGVYFRQFVPPSQKVKFDLVVSSFTLIELPSRKERLKALNTLWKKTDRFLVVVENGTNAGYALIMEARDYILGIGNVREEHSKGTRSTTDMEAGHVFAPCAHDLACPRRLRNDKTPCNFEIDYSRLSQSVLKEKLDTVRVSYVVFQKGPRDNTEVSWPRIVRPVSTPSKRVHLRTCTSDGQLEYSIITASKHSKELYQCARASQWGDQLPVVPRRQEQEQVREQLRQTETVDTINQTDIDSGTADRSSETVTSSNTTKSDDNSLPVLS